MLTRLLPAPAGPVDPTDLYGSDDRAVPERRPYVLVNMVESVDGAVSVDGVTAPLGGPTDRAIFIHLRNQADAILVGASTVRAEGYGPARPRAHARDARVERGQRPYPPIAVVTRSVSFDWESPFFAEAHVSPIVIAPATTDPSVLERAGRRADVVACGDGDVDLVAALAALRERGIRILLCEGGPTVNAELARLGLVDEVCLSVAPAVFSGRHPRGILGPAPAGVAASLSLAHVLEEEGFLYLRYLRA